MAMARCDLPVPVPPMRTALRCALRGHEDDERLGPLVSDWESKTRGEFLAAYEEAARILPGMKQVWATANDDRWKTASR